MQLQEPKARESLLTPSMRRSSSRTSLNSTNDSAQTSSQTQLPSSSSAPSSLTASTPSMKSLPPDPMSPLPQITAANAALMERATFAIDDAKDEGEEDEEDETFGIGGDDDEVMDEVDAFLEAHDSGLSAADQELAKGVSLAKPHCLLDVLSLCCLQMSPRLRL